MSSSRVHCTLTGARQFERPRRGHRLDDHVGVETARRPKPPPVFMTWSRTLSGGDAGRPGRRRPGRGRAPGARPRPRACRRRSCAPPRSAARARHGRDTGTRSAPRAPAPRRRSPPRRRPPVQRRPPGAAAASSRYSARISAEPRVSAPVSSHSTVTASRPLSAAHMCSADHRQPARRLHDVDDARHRLRRRRVERLRRSAPNFGGWIITAVSIPGSFTSMREGMRAVGLRRAVVAADASRCRSASTAPAPSASARPAPASPPPSRPARRSSRLPAGRMRHPAVGHRDLAGRHAPVLGRGGDQHRARRRAGLAIAVPGRGHRGRAAGAPGTPPAARLP